MKLKKYRVFYHFAAEDETVEPEENRVMNEADIYSPLLGRLKSTGDYIGLIDANEKTAQVMYKSDTDQYWLEVIDEERQGAHGRFFSFDEIVEIFKTLPEHFSPQKFPGLEFHTWKDLE